MLYLLLYLFYNLIFFQECEKKHADYLKNEASIKTEFLTLCKQLGIKGDKIKRELVERLKGLPEIYDKVGYCNCLRLQ